MKPNNRGTETAEEKVMRLAMEWYRWTITQGMDHTDYRGLSQEQWLACKELDAKQKAAA